ncbi:hypothetical protein [Paracoccus yeei]|uniref:hypothetical protein n=2 Tax=Paracoccus yeei TaxID=147645 RepID=UPI000B49C64E
MGKMAGTAGKGSVRCAAINLGGLAAQERHGKRLDGSSQRRRIRDDRPHVYRTLDLCDAYERHMQGVKQNAGATKPILHFIVRFPPELLAGDDVPEPYRGKSRAERQGMMLRQAVLFINETHGGDAVFAARIDRDEEGETIADVFAVPRYEKRTKRTKPDERGAIWASATKFGRDLAEKRQDEIRRRHPDAKPGLLTGPRQVGIALQSEFAEFFERENGIPLSPKQEKAERRSDRVEVEAWRQIEAARAVLAADAAAIEKRRDVQMRWDARRGARIEREATLLRGERKQVTAMRGRLSAMLDQMERGMRVVLSFGPRIRQVLADAEASASERVKARKARADVVHAVPQMRRDISSTRDIMEMMRASSLSEDSLDPVPDGDRRDDGPGFGEP